MPASLPGNSIKWSTAHIALGSNLGDRSRFIDAALNALRGHKAVRVMCVSETIETEPVGLPGQGRYLNAAAILRTPMTPRDLLDTMLIIEQELGRDRGLELRNGPRVIDLDLLFYDDLVLDEPRLTVPHPRLHERRFVLEPLASVAPDHVHPVLGLTVHAMLQALVAGESTLVGTGQSIGDLGALRRHGSKT